MSKLRQDIDCSAVGTELASPGEGDLGAFVVFTQVRRDAPHVYAGWLDAADEAMAIRFALDHYGRDQKCVNIWVAPRDFVAGLRVNAEASTEEVPERRYQIFVQGAAGDPHVSGDCVNATSARNALDAAWATLDDPEAVHNLWAVPCAEITATDEVDVIWNATDQTYRLARGYSRDVREKWQAIREKHELAAYEKDDLKDTF